MVTAALMTATERAELLDVIEEVSGIGSFVWVPDKTISWSRGFYRLLGIDPSVPPSAEAYFERVHPDDRARVVMAAGTVVTRSDVEIFPYRIVRPDGTFDWVIGPHKIEHDADGKLTRVIGAIVRITDQHLVNERLAQVNSLLADTQRAAGVGSYMYDPATQKLEWSDELFRVLGVAPGGPLESKHLIHEDDKARQEEWAMRVMAGETMPPLMVRMQRPADGRWIFIEAIARRVDRPTGPCFVGIVQDITARVEMEQELRHAARSEAVGALAAGVAHDFNNYLTVLSAQLEMTRLRGGQARPSDMETMSVALERCAGLVRQLLAFARKHPYRPERLDLAARVDTVRQLFERVVEPSLKIEVVQSARPVVHGDATQIDGALMNLLVNARDAMEGAARCASSSTSASSAKGTCVSRAA